MRRTPAEISFRDDFKYANFSSVSDIGTAAQFHRHARESITGQHRRIFHQTSRSHPLLPQLASLQYALNVLQQSMYLPVLLPVATLFCCQARGQ